MSYFGWSVWTGGVSFEDHGDGLVLTYVIVRGLLGVSVIVFINILACGGGRCLRHNSSQRILAVSISALICGRFMTSSMFRHKLLWLLLLSIFLILYVMMTIPFLLFSIFHLLLPVHSVFHTTLTRLKRPTLVLVQRSCILVHILVLVVFVVASVSIHLIEMQRLQNRTLEPAACQWRSRWRRHARHISRAPLSVVGLYV